MPIRTTQLSIINLVKSGIASNRAKMVEAQERIATGKRILRPSDDAVGTALSLSLRRQAGDVDRLLETIGAARPLLQTAASTLEQSGGLFAETRALVLQGMNGAMSAAGRVTLADGVEQMREQLLELANTKFGGTYLFGGTRTSSPPYQKDAAEVVYQGDEHVQRVRVGGVTDLAVNIPGSELFGRFDPSGVSIAGVSGAALGTSANEGQGFAELHVRHDATSGALGAGLAFVAGGAADTFLNDRSLVVDGTAGTVQLGGGTALTLPQPGDPDVADFVVYDENGAELHLDFSGYSGGDVATTVRGDGSLSLDGTNYVAIDFAATDVELIDAANGAVLHVDATGIVRASTDLVTFEGAVDAFELLAAVAADLRNVDGVSTAELQGRLGERLGELDRVHENVLTGLSSLGARLERLDDAENRLGEVDLHLQGLLSNTEDADLAEVVLDLTRAEQTLQVAQATGARLIQNTLLNYLR